MIDHYDPEVAPDPVTWLALDESERIHLVEEFHREARIPLPKSARALHAVIHTIVENQLALDDQEIVRDTLHRLLEEGHTRHDALHAIGAILAERIADHFQENPGTVADDASYHAALQGLTNEK